MEAITDYIIYSGSAIRQERKAKKLRIDVFAQMIKVSSGQASNFENGKRFPDADELLRMKEVFGKPILII